MHDAQDSTTVFQPTRFATNLTSHMQSLADSERTEEGREGPQGFIVLETNYHIYAYTSAVHSSSPYNAN